MKTEVEEVKESQVLINNKFEENQRDVYAVKQSYRKMNEKCDNIEDANRILHDKCYYLKNQIIDLKQWQFNSTFTISDMPVTPNEDLRNIVNQILTHLVNIH